MRPIVVCFLVFASDGSCPRMHAGADVLGLARLLLRGCSTVTEACCTMAAVQVNTLLLAMQAGHPVTMLSVQYRMHPKISSFISEYFYQKQLTDGPGLDRCGELRHD